MTPNPARVNAIAKEYRRWIEARQKMERHIRITFPVGAEVFYRHGDHIRFATVVQHLYGFHLRLQGRSGKIYDLHANRIVQEMAERGI